MAFQSDARTTTNPRATTFVGGRSGSLSVTSQTTITGPPLPSVAFIDVVRGIVADPPPGTGWLLCGVTTNVRYATLAEQTALNARQISLGRPEATAAALILLRKRAEWWALAQDERRAILEEDSHHIAIGMRYLPAIARRLFHCRDLEAEAPFDFVGFLDFAPAHATAFDDMLGRLRATREWSFMDREIDIRLARAGGS